MIVQNEEPCTSSVYLYLYMCVFIGLDWYDIVFYSLLVINLAHFGAKKNIFKMIQAHSISSKIAGFSWIKTWHDLKKWGLTDPLTISKRQSQSNNVSKLYKTCLSRRLFCESVGRMGFLSLLNSHFPIHTWLHPRHVCLFSSFRFCSPNVPY